VRKPKKTTPPSPPALWASDKARAAFHEAGHWVVARHFGAAGSCWIIERGTPTKENKAFTGQTEFKVKTTPFREAVIGWAGDLGEAAYDEDLNRCKDLDRWREEVEMREDDMIWDYCEDYEARPDELSATDIESINGHPWKRRTFKTAIEIIAKRFVLFKDVAKNLVQNGVYPRCTLPLQGACPRLPRLATRITAQRGFKGSHQTGPASPASAKATARQAISPASWALPVTPPSRSKRLPACAPARCGADSASLTSPGRASTPAAVPARLAIPPVRPERPITDPSARAARFWRWCDPEGATGRR